MKHMFYYVFVLFNPYKVDGLLNAGWRPISHHFTFQVPGIRVEEINEIVQKEIDRKSDELLAKYVADFSIYYKATSLSVSVIEK